MANFRWPTRVLLAVAGFFCIAVAGWYAPILTAVGWRVFHPRGRVDYRGLQIPVPWPWTADTSADASVNPEGISLKKMPSTMDRRLPVQSIFITVISSDPGISEEGQTAAWMSSFQATHPGEEFEGLAEGTPADASCLGTRSRWNQPGVVWTCISVKRGWVADFEGQASGTASFFRIVGGLRR